MFVIVVLAVLAVSVVDVGAAAVVGAAVIFDVGVIVVMCVALYVWRRSSWWRRRLLSRFRENPVEYRSWAGFGRGGGGPWNSGTSRGS